jgi:hypothetical protein
MRIESWDSPRIKQCGEQLPITRFALPPSVSSRCGGSFLELQIRLDSTLAIHRRHKLDGRASAFVNRSRRLPWCKCPALGTAADTFK